MVMLAEHYDFVIGGDPDRDTIDLAVLDTRTGGVCAHLVDRADAAGYRRLLDWAQLHAPGRRVWALEGTGSFAAGLATVLAEADEDVVEITGGRRSRGAKNDRIDNAAAARTALASEQQASPAPSLWRCGPAPGCSWLRRAAAGPPCAERPQGSRCGPTRRSSCGVRSGPSAVAGPRCRSARAAAC